MTLIYLKKFNLYLSICLLKIAYNFELAVETIILNWYEDSSSSALYFFIGIEQLFFR